MDDYHECDGCDYFDGVVCELKPGEEPSPNAYIADMCTDLYREPDDWDEDEYDEDPTL